jgi:hypothetical protein
MPFERLMEQVAALDAEDQQKPMGELARRWEEPVQRIADAIDAVRVMRGERTYISVRPEPEPEQKPCQGFRWIGQPFTSCDRCGMPAWEHPGEARPRPGMSLSEMISGDAWEIRPWGPGEAEAIRRKWGPS